MFCSEIIYLILLFGISQISALERFQCGPEDLDTTCSSTLNQTSVRNLIECATKCKDVDSCAAFAFNTTSLKCWTCDAGGAASLVPETGTNTYFLGGKPPSTSSYDSTTDSYTTDHPTSTLSSSGLCKLLLTLSYFFL